VTDASIVEGFYEFKEVFDRSMLKATYRTLALICVPILREWAEEVLKINNDARAN